MADEDLRELERRWAEGQGDLAAGEAFSRALERAGAEVGRRLEVRLQVLRAHISTAGLGRLTLGPQPELDPMAASFLIPGEEALGAWHALRARTEASGAYPVIVGSDAEFERMVEGISERPDVSPSQILVAADAVDVPIPAGGVEWEDRWWPREAEPRTEFRLPHDPSTGDPRTVRVVLLPTATPWHAAAFLRFGQSTRLRDGSRGANRRPHEHVAWHRSWYVRFGAEPFGIAFDDAELWVARPPQMREESVRLAVEQERYCRRLRVDAPVEVRGTTLVGATAWHFSW